MTVSSSNNRPKYDMRINPIYQIGFSNEASGKMFSGTKRRATFKFGFSNAKAIEEGCVGPDCRGEEHEIQVILSVTSGKRQILMDGKEVHFSKGGVTESKFQYSWSILGGHMVKLIARSSPSSLHHPGYRQFDLLIDGLTYFKFPQIYELGGKGGTGFKPKKIEATSSIRSMPEPQGRRAGMETLRVEKSDPGMAVSDLLGDDLLSTSSSPTLTMASGASSFDTTDDLFAPKAAPPPTFAAISNSILSAYEPSPQEMNAIVPVAAPGPSPYVMELAATTVPNPYDNQAPQQQMPQPPPAQAFVQQPHGFAQPPAPTQAFQPPAQTYAQAPMQNYSQPPMYAQPPAQTNAQGRSPSPTQSYASAPPTFAAPDAESYGSPPPTEVEEARLSMESLSMEPLEEPAQESGNAMQKAVSSLVNLDDMNFGSTKQAPVMQSYVGCSQTLGDMKKTAGPKPPKEIMRTYEACAPHGQPQQYYHPPQPMFAS